MKRTSIVFAFLLLLIQFKLSAQWLKNGTSLTTSDKVGIGTLSPEAILDVKGNSTTLLKVQGADNGYINAGILLQANDDSDYRGLGLFMQNMAGQREWFAGNPYAQPDKYIIARKTNNTIHAHNVAQVTNSLFTVDGNGKVGIGTHIPRVKLDVSGHLLLDPGSNPFIYTGAGTNELNRYLSIVNSPDKETASGLKVGGILVADAYNYAYPGKNDLIVKGNIGVGHANPSAKLDVNGTIKASNLSLSQGIKLGFSTNPIAGSIRFNNGQFEGHNGSQWINLGSNSATGSGICSDCQFLTLTNKNTFVGRNSGFTQIYIDASRERGQIDENLGQFNTALGVFSGNSIGNGKNGLYLGYAAGRDNQSGNNNVFLGAFAGEKNMHGHSNIFIGTDSGRKNKFGHSNISIGNRALEQSEYNSNNLAIGQVSMYKLTEGTRNVGIGDSTLFEYRIGKDNIAIGSKAGSFWHEGFRNVFIGTDSKGSGDGNIFIGHRSGLRRLYSGGYDRVFSPGNVFVIDNGGENTAPILQGDFISGIVHTRSGVQIGNTTIEIPGLIRTGSDFEGFDGTQWISFTNNQITNSLKAINSSSKEESLIDQLQAEIKALKDSLQFQKVMFQDFIERLENLERSTATQTLDISQDHPDLVLNSDFELFPNPTKDIVWVKSKTQFKKVTFEIIDINGKRIVQLDTNGGNLIDGIPISLQEHANGIYQLIISGDNRIESFKIVKK